MSSALEIEDRAARWLLRSEEPHWSKEDQAALDDWLDQSMAHKAAFWRLQHGWREADRIGALGQDEAVVRSSVRPHVRRWWNPYACAASVIAILGIGEFRAHVPERVEIARMDTPIGGSKIVPLADGSRIEMNTATTLRARTGTSREVWLDTGEAFFDVRHSNEVPFVVHAGKRTITDLGTKFSVRRDGDKVTVSVLEGKVRVDDGTSAQNDRSVIIAAGDTAIGLGTSTLIAPRSGARVEDMLAWRSGSLRFDQTTLAEAAAEFNRYNRKPIIITDAETASIRIGGTFKASNAAAFVRLLSDAYGLRVTTDPNAIKISS
ncbi:FecR family protein [Sphingomonas hylomeconis]|uniref:FecR family protein n=1 Tax=Sphingomonas hylomeconis TaxID=1395958 RepID=A0ABV7SSN4_9SPHN|nr:FecR domain-containing protein [Sphingomonas hylomeconis]